MEQSGWKVLDPPARKAESEEPELPAGLEPGLGVKVEEARAVPKKTNVLRARPQRGDRGIGPLPRLHG